MVSERAAEAVVRSEGMEPAARVARLLRQRGTLSRAEISRLSGLAKSTVSEVVAALKQAGVVVDATTGQQRSGRQGRPRTGVMLNPAAGACVGVDFGFRTVRAIVADVSHAILAHRSEYVGQDYSLDIAALAARELVNEVIKTAEINPEQVLGIGAAVPGPLDPTTGTVSRSSMIPSWTGTEIAAELEHHLGYRVWADNDSNCGALAESMWGAGHAARSMAYLKLHSGVGGGLVMGGRLVRGFSGTAGEFGHIIIDPRGPLCRCGKRGCLEAYVGIPAIISQFQPRYGTDFTVGDLARLVADNDPGCEVVLGDAAELIGQALSAVHNIFNPERVVIGGALTGIAPHLVHKIAASFPKYCRTSADGGGGVLPDLVAGTLGMNASALGAVGLVLTDLPPRPGADLPGSPLP